MNQAIKILTFTIAALIATTCWAGTIVEDQVKEMEARERQGLPINEHQYSAAAIRSFDLRAISRYNAERVQFKRIEVAEMEAKEARGEDVDLKKYSPGAVDSYLTRGIYRDLAKEEAEVERQIAEMEAKDARGEEINFNIYYRSAVQRFLTRDALKACHRRMSLE